VYLNLKRPIECDSCVSQSTETVNDFFIFVFTFFYAEIGLFSFEKKKRKQLQSLFEKEKKKCNKTLFFHRRRAALCVVNVAQRNAQLLALVARQAKHQSLLTATMSKSWSMYWNRLSTALTLVLANDSLGTRLGRTTTMLGANQTVSHYQSETTRG
jgi:hypothetical protein